ncbi:MAG: hypothetical protein PHV59_01100 [Victivallales bacterium]|nr:hypothetical protein [Victivallales bacterium]
MKSFLTAIRKKHEKIWYIGDGTIACDAGSISEMFKFCQASGFEKYMACGTPIPDMGLRWLKVTENMLLEMKVLYRKLYAGA